MNNVEIIPDYNLRSEVTEASAQNGLQSDDFGISVVPVDIVLKCK